MPSLHWLIGEIGAAQPPLTRPGAALVGLAALGAVGLSASWRVVRHIQVMAHEASHAVVGSALGMRITGVRLMRDGRGETRMRTGRGGDVATTLAGYLGPSAYGLGVAGLLAARHSAAVLWFTLLLLLALLALLRNLFGALSVLALGALILAIAWYAPVGWQTIAAYGIAWVLLLSGVRNVVHRWSGSADAAHLAAITPLPALAWAWLWLVATVAALAAGAFLLLR